MNRKHLPATYGFNLDGTPHQVPAPPLRFDRQERFAMTLIAVVVIGFLIGIFAPWDRLPWNTTMAPCSAGVDTITHEEGMTFCDG